MSKRDLQLWQERLEKNRGELADDYLQMDKRERLYRGFEFRLSGFLLRRF